MSRLLAVACALELPSERLDVEEAILAEAGAELRDRRGVPLDELGPELAEADAVLTEALGRERFDAARIARLARCRVISVYAAGADGVDAAAAAARGIAVRNVPDYCTAEVAEHTLALLLAAWRRLPRAERTVAAGRWRVDELRPVRRLAGRTVGLLGFGRIAREVAARLAGFGVAVLAYDPAADEAAARQLGVRLCGREELFAQSDALCVHVPLTGETRGLVGREALALLPRGAVLVNAARGEVVDRDALLEALSSGRLAGAALDVLPQEPPAPGEPLLAREDVLCTPHMAYYSEESLHALRVAAATNAAAVLRGAAAAPAPRATDGS